MKSEKKIVVVEERHGEREKVKGEASWKFDLCFLRHVVEVNCVDLGWDGWVWRGKGGWGGGQGLLS
jgi:hypothetical protein